VIASVGESPAPIDEPAAPDSRSIEVTASLYSHATYAVAYEPPTIYAIFPFGVIATASGFCRALVTVPPVFASASTGDIVALRFAM
jgi:hypothetical protein